MLPACERAVALATDDPAIRDSRGLSRAMVGDVKGAIEDFQFYVENIEQSGSPSHKEQRQAWIEALKAGRNPFDQVTLKQIRDQ